VTALSRTLAVVLVQGGQVIVILDVATDMALFSQRPAVVADNSQPAFPLQFKLPYIIEES
jgi:hypothetical protein